MCKLNSMKRLFFILTIVGIVAMVISLLGMVLLYNTIFFAMTFTIVSTITLVCMLIFDKLYKKELANI